MEQAMRYELWFSRDWRCVDVCVDIWLGVFSVLGRSRIWTSNNLSLCSSAVFTSRLPAYSA
jgi:hypothetical protein